MGSLYRHFVSCLATKVCLAMACLATVCLAMACLAMACLAMVCLATVCLAHIATARCNRLLLVLHLILRLNYLLCIY